jgi:Domain of unknown function (DUF1893)
MSTVRGVPPLPDGATMAIWPLVAVEADGTEVGPPIYVSRGRWLHPLFELLDLQAGTGDVAGDVARDVAAAPAEAGAGADARRVLDAAGELFLRDRVIGRGAAYLILRAGIRHAWADVVSDGAAAVFAANGADLDGGERVPAIGCMTEELLSGVDDPGAACELLSARRRVAVRAAAEG